jgi:glycosyltransferase involved in cell wall biosynthesis
MKILFLTDNFPPEVNAPATRTFEHCREWVKAGAEVTVITCFPNFPLGKVYAGYKNQLKKTEWIEGIKVIRIWSYITANEGFAKRILDYISFSVTSFLAGLFEKTDLIIATSPQFFVALTGRALSFWKHKPWIMEVRDLWPESIKTVGAMKNNLFIRYFEWQEMRCYRSAKKIIVVTNLFKKKLVDRGIDASKIEIIKNGSNRQLFQPKPKNEEIIGRLGLAGKKILGYIGTQGMAHKLDFILNCAKLLLTSGPQYHFLFIGNGAEKKALLKKADDEHLTNVTMLDTVPKKEVVEYLSILDAAIINLKKSELFKSVIPSKIFETAAMQIPVLLGVDGEARSIIEQYGAGLYYEPENQADFIQKINQLFSNELNYRHFKKGGSHLAEAFDRRALAMQMLDILVRAACCNKHEIRLNPYHPR